MKVCPIPASADIVPSPPRALLSERNNAQSGYPVEMTHVAGKYCIALLDSGRSDDQIVERQHVTFCCLLALDLTDQPGRPISNGMNRNQAYKFLDVLTAALPSFSVFER